MNRGSGAGPLGDTGNMVAAHVAAVGVVTTTWLLAFGWFWQAVAALRGMPTLPDLTRLDTAALPELPHGNGPHLTVIVPACNEEKAIKATLHRSLLLRGCGLRSLRLTTARPTAQATMDEVAEEFHGGPHRLQVIHNRQLPEGWLGKPHALQLGAECASAPWLLFTDADVVFSPTALELALRYALQQNVDYLVLNPIRSAPSSPSSNSGCQGKSRTLRDSAREYARRSPHAHRAVPFDEARQQSQMIVLHKDYGSLVGHLFKQRIGKPLVHESIALPVCRAEDGPRMRDVAKRPKALVGEAPQ